MVVWRTRQEYDRYGNMPCVQNSNSDEPRPRWAFDASTNQLSSSGFAYDAAGHLTTDVSGAATRTYAWDAEGRLTQVTDNGGNTTTSYVYNALGQEVELKTVGSWQLEQAFDPQGQRVGYYSAGGSQWRLAYVPWQGRELAKYASTTSFNFFHPNALGSAAISTDQTGTVDDDMAFYPWGQVWLNSGSNTYDTHFAGVHAALQGSNLIDFTMDEAPYRFYAPNPGRWHSPDPLGGDITNPQSLNRYAYALNNPTSLIDPLGLNAGDPMNCWYDDSGVLHCDPTGGTGDGEGSDEDNSSKDAAFGADQGAADNGSSWWGTSATTFLTNFVSLDFYKSELSNNGCLNTFVSASVDALNPASPSLAGPGGGRNYGRVSRHAVQRRPGICGFANQCPRRAGADIPAEVNPI